MTNSTFVASFLFNILLNRMVFKKFSDTEPWNYLYLTVLKLMQEEIKGNRVHSHGLPRPFGYNIHHKTILKHIFFLWDPSCSVISSETLLGQMPSAITMACFSVSKGYAIPVAIEALQYRF